MIKSVFLLSTLGCLSTFAAPIVTTNLLLNPGGEANNLTGWIVGGDSGPRLDNGSFDVSIVPHSGSNDFVAGTGAFGSLSQVVALAGNQGVTSASIDTGTLFAYVSFWEQSLNQGDPSDDAYVTVAFLNAISNTVSSWTSPEIDARFLTWSNYSAYIPIPPGTRYAQYTMNFVRHAGNDSDGFMDDNVLSVADSVQIPNLNLATSSTNAVIYWPVLYADGFVLQQTTNLVATNWTLISPLKIVNGTNQVAVSPLIKNQFFRLYHP